MWMIGITGLAARGLAASVAAAPAGAADVKVAVVNSTHPNSFDSTAETKKHRNQ